MATDAPSWPVEEDDRAAGEVKHAFVHITMHRDWVKNPLQLRVSKRLEISVNGGPCHGSALYGNATGKGRWILTFHYNADMDYAKELTFLQVPGTASYMNLQETAKSYNAMLITRTEW